MALNQENRAEKEAGLINEMRWEYRAKCSSNIKQIFIQCSHFTGRFCAKKYTGGME